MQTGIVHTLLIKLITHQVVNRQKEMFATKKHYVKVLKPHGLCYHIWALWKML